MNFQKHGNKTIRIIHTVIRYGWTRYQKYRVELAIRYDKKMVCWLSEKQMSSLLKYFPGGWGYSTKDYSVFAAFEGDRFIWASDDPTWLCRWLKIEEAHIPDKDAERYITGIPPKLEVPENVEILDEFQDDIRVDATPISTD